MSNTVFVFTGIDLFSFLLQTALFVLQIAAFWFLFVKANVAGWKSIIPIYSEYKIYKIVWKPKFFGLYLLLLIANGVITTLLSGADYYSGSIVFLTTIRYIIVLACCLVQFFFCRHLAFSYGKGTGFAVGLFFLYPIFILILGLGRSKYRGNSSNR